MLIVTMVAVPLGIRVVKWYRTDTFRIIYNRTAADTLAGILVTATAHCIEGHPVSVVAKCIGLGLFLRASADDM
jgi:hypothetical protein